MFINRCPFCNSPVSSDSSLCPSCRKLADTEKFDSFAVRCSVCSYPLVSSLYKCPRCRKGKTERIFSIYDYRAPFFRHILEQWKFEGRRTYTALMAQEYYNVLCQNYPDLENIVLVPVPCSAQSLKRRKWDQMKDVALHLKRKHGLKCSFLLVNSQKSGLQQKTLDRKRRISASEGKYTFNEELGAKEDKDKTYIVMDDISTTESTIRSCMSLLRENGFTDVQGLTLMAEL